ncbi:hypothetical protein SUGI_0928290 [Cryptomeria japonica]|uniref:bZIP transcription factor 17 n=1 Tax=Cryptomeria japonica TaxID=3369 RepID=UPI002414A694|nr:bZIP transcription factor 17 [Cryptomeria japonica]GLJ44331.1 hypothetical protein SUGI_0928290 [Cryptomeria japonica]
MEELSGSEGMSVDLHLPPDLDIHPDLDLDLENSFFDDPAWLDSVLNDSFNDSFDINFDPHPSLSPSQDSFTPAAADFDDKEEDKSVPPPSSSPSSSSSTNTNAPTAQGNLPKPAFSDGNDEEAKRNARLMRNRESAQLSRQRKKNYIDELEEKVKSANSTIAELNNTVAYLSAENVKLKQQLASLNPNANPLPCYPSWPPPFPYPAYPLPAVAAAGRVPLLPIPRLKSSPPSSKSRKKSLSKTQHHDENPSKRIKKMASVAFLGFFSIIILLFGGIDTFRSNVTELSPGLYLLNGGGRVLTSWKGYNSTVPHFKPVNNNIYDLDRGKGKGKEEIINSAYPQNLSEPLVASLFVPRNDKLVKIDGNLIIHAVLAGEKALKSNKEDIVSDKRESEKNSLALITERHRALAVARAAGPNFEMRNHLYEAAAENQRALASNSKNDYKEDRKPTSVDRSLQQWFREGHAGPVLGSGMCTEVFQFDTSPNSPATTRNSRIVTSVSSSVANGSVEQSRNSSSGSKINEARRLGQINNLKNRRVSYAVPLPPARSSLNVTNERNLTDHTERIHEDRGYQRQPSSMVVSVLVDPRETGDEGMLSSGSLSRIFVVVLIDRVKYVTYSCVLPKASVPHLARN